MFRRSIGGKKGRIVFKAKLWLKGFINISLFYRAEGARNFERIIYVRVKIGSQNVMLYDRFGI